jgi:hypothetical protein
MGRATEFFDYLNNDYTKPEFDARYFNISFNQARKDKLWVIATLNETRVVCINCGNIILKIVAGNKKATSCKKCNKQGQWIKEKDLKAIT